MRKAILLGQFSVDLILLAVDIGGSQAALEAPNNFAERMAIKKGSARFLLLRGVECSGCIY